MFPIVTANNPMSVPLLPPKPQAPAANTSRTDERDAPIGHVSTQADDRQATSLELSKTSIAEKGTPSTHPQWSLPTHLREQQGREGQFARANATPIFVLGSGRSGTTMMGKFIASSPAVLDLNEYFGFHVTHNTAVGEMAGAPTPVRDTFQQWLQHQALYFASMHCADSNTRYFCDSTPWNLESAETLVAAAPHAIFILMIRHYAGVAISLEDSYASGYRWAGATWEQRAELWQRCYEHVRFLPPERTVAIDYDSLCLAPQPTLDRAMKRLQTLQFPVQTLSFDAFAQKHAQSRDKGRCLALRTRDGIVFNPIKSFDASRWNEDIEQRVHPLVQPAIKIVEQCFPGSFRTDLFAAPTSRGAA